MNPTFRSPQPSRNFQNFKPSIFSAGPFSHQSSSSSEHIQVEPISKQLTKLNPNQETSFNFNFSETDETPKITAVLYNLTSL